MAHNVRTQVDATWTTGNYVTLASDWQSLDAKVKGGVNGDLGGCWAPSSLITLIGTYPGAAQVRVTGPVVIDYGGSINVVDGTYFAAIVRLAGADWPKFSASHVLRTRTIVTSCMLRQASPLWFWHNDLVYGGAQSIACTVQWQPFGVDYFTGAIRALGWDGSGKPPGLLQPSFLLPLRVHDGARFVSATLTFRVPSARASAPLVPPQLRIIRADAAGNLTVLKSVASGANPNGYLPVATPTSGAAWFNSGLVQSVTYTCDQNQTIDVSRYTYWAQIVEEVGTLVAIPPSTCDGTLVRERKLDVTACATTAIALTGTVTVDGVSCGAAGSPGYGGTQDRVLATAQADASQNGIWIANSAGAWTRAPDLQVAQDFSPGFVVHVMKGTANIGTVWECKAPTNAQAVTLSAATVLTGTPVTFQRRKARGNIYHAVACNFDSIADMRWQ